MKNENFFTDSYQNRFVTDEQIMLIYQGREIIVNIFVPWLFLLYFCNSKCSALTQWY